MDDWIRDLQRNVEQDDDNLILYVGDPGVGKSTFAFQVNVAVDDSFDVNRVAFSIPGFVRLSKRTPKRHAIQGDELLAAARKAMYADNIELNDRLQVCRGKNHTMAALFPFERRLDGAILDERVRYKVEIPERGSFILTQRKVHKRYVAGGDVVRRVVWVERLRGTFEENRGRKWREYQTAKDAHMNALDEAEEETPAVPKAVALCSDRAGLVAYIVRAREAQERERGAALN